MSEEQPEGPTQASVALIEDIMAAGPRSLAKRKPKESMMALELIAAGEQWEKIAELTGLSFNQISGLSARHEMAIEERKKELARDGFEMAKGLSLLIKQKMEQLANNPDALAKTNLRDLVLPYGIAVDKGMLALGEQKTIIEHRAGKPSLKDAMAAIEEARAKLRQDSVEVVTRPVQVVSNEIKNAQ